MSDIERCHECGSWDKQCNSEHPVNGCACARCTRDMLRRSRRNVVETSRQVADLCKAMNAIMALHPDNATDALLIADEAMARYRREPT